jgi:ethanolamine ammonia-lyase small subunit
MTALIEPNPWDAWRRFTRARIALGRSGDSLPTDALLAFELAHAQARDAVYAALAVARLGEQARAAGLRELVVHSAAPDREHYLRRPDLGRRLAEDSRAMLASLEPGAAPASDIVFVIADGLSAHAANHHALPLLQALMPALHDWAVGPLVIAQQARVALGDQIGELLAARFVVMLIGERPGLSSPDSLGIYITCAPRVGRSDAERNCISNVRPQGLSYADAAFKLHYLLTHARRLGLTGVGLKDDSDGLLPGNVPRPPAMTNDGDG